MKFYIMNFFSKCDQIRRKLWIWSHLLKKSLMENVIVSAVEKEPGIYTKELVYLSSTDKVVKGNPKYDL